MARGESDSPDLDALDHGGGKLVQFDRALVRVGRGQTHAVELGIHVTIGQAAHHGVLAVLNRSPGHEIQGTGRVTHPGQAHLLRTHSVHHCRALHAYIQQAHLRTAAQFQILDDELDLDVAKSRQELVRVATGMVRQNPEVGAIVLECTNMTPYAAAIQEKTELPVFDIYTLVNYVYNAVVRKSFSGYM